MKPILSLLAVLPAFALMSCSNSGGDPNYDTTDPYGAPGQQQATAAPAAADGETGNYQALTPGSAPASAPATAAAPSSNPTYAPAVYEDNATSPSDAAPVKRAPTSAAARATAPANHVMDDEKPAARSSGSVHTVVKGDSLWSIGKKYGVSVTSLKAENNLTKDTVILGQKVRIPAH